MLLALNFKDLVKICLKVPTRTFSNCYQQGNFKSSFSVHYYYLFLMRQVLHLTHFFNDLLRYNDTSLLMIVKPTVYYFQIIFMHLH